MKLPLPEGYSFSAPVNSALKMMYGGGAASGYAARAFAGKPGGYGVYGGSSIWTMLDAEGIRWVVATGTRPGGEFGPFIYKIINNRCIVQDLPRELIEHVGCWVEVNWARGTAEILQFKSDKEGPTIVPLQGFYVGKVEGPVIVETPVANPQPVQNTDCVDAAARKYTTDVKKELMAKDSVIEQTVAQLAARIAKLEATGGSIDIQAVRDYLWNSDFIVDKVYADMLRGEDSGIYELIVEIVASHSSGEGIFDIENVLEKVAEKLLA